MSAISLPNGPPEAEVAAPLDSKKKKRKNNFISYLSEKLSKLETSSQPKCKAQFETLWSEFEEHMKQMYVQMEDRQTLKKEVYIKLYSEVHDMCCAEPDESSYRSLRRYNASSSTYPATLYSRIEAFFQQHLKQIGHQGCHLTDNKEVLKFYSKQCRDFYSSSKTLNGVCSYLNRNWVVSEQLAKRNDIRDIYQLALTSWRKTLFQILNQKVTASILEIVQNDREDGNVDCVFAGEVRDVINSYVAIGRFDTTNDSNNNNTASGLAADQDDLSVYTEFFEAAFLDATKNYYNANMARFVNENDPTGAILILDGILLEEEARVDQLFHESTKLKVVSVCLKTLVVKNLETLYTVFKTFLLESKMDELRSFYGIIRRLSNAYLVEMADKFEAYIVEFATADLGVINRPPELFCEELIKFNNKFKGIVAGPFENSQPLKQAMDRACEKFLNSGQNIIIARTPGYLAKYADSLLQRRPIVARNKTEEELDAKLQDILSMLAFVRDKNLFQLYTSNFLGQRLFCKTYASLDLETNFITSLATPCSTLYMRKLETMFTEMINVSKLVNANFRASHPTAQNFNFYVCVLASSAWSLPVTPFTFPPELQNTIETFNGFYKRVHDTRKLTWIPNKCTGELSFKPRAKKYILVVSTYEMAVFLMFNKASQYSMAELLEATNLDMIKLAQVVDNLAAKNFLIVKRTSDEQPSTSSGSDGNTEVGAIGVSDPETMVSINRDFHDVRIKINLNLKLRTEVQREKEKLDEDIKRSREFTLQAVIVKIMKADKKLTKNNLEIKAAEDCRQNYQYYPNVETMREQITILIDKEYLREVKEPDKNKVEILMYEYLA